MSDVAQSNNEHGEGDTMEVGVVTLVYRLHRTMKWSQFGELINTINNNRRSENGELSRGFQRLHLSVCVCVPSP